LSLSTTDEKEKFDPGAFRDSIFAGLVEPDLDAASKFLDVAGNKLDYRRYGETLFDILIAGGILAPGGTIVVDADPSKASKSELSLFACDGEMESVRGHLQVIVKLIRRYKYLEKTLEESMKKITVFLKGFAQEDRDKLAKMTGLLLAGGHVSCAVLQSALQDHLVKDGIAAEFLVGVLSVWLAEKDATTLWASLRKAQLDSKLLVSNETPLDDLFIST